ncbi:hypothetical protein [Actinacidiphila acididurans]|uniref:HNH endonuclease n=1 Tax=Actinacidiphila acididurans TaxID=2784346 RepID=A0ABS2TSM5_9ACTN|nr:hypothetical protein [Actinacidiphila acididurans]MBM9505822.1 hypothetical protein [Actinacidiphila acididurans]
MEVFLPASGEVRRKCCRNAHPGLEQVDRIMVVTRNRRFKIDHWIGWIWAKASGNIANFDPTESNLRHKARAPLFHGRALRLKPNKRSGMCP